MGLKRSLKWIRNWAQISEKKTLMDMTVENVTNVYFPLYWPSLKSLSRILILYKNFSLNLRQGMLASETTLPENLLTIPASTSLQHFLSKNIFPGAFCIYEAFFDYASKMAPQDVHCHLPTGQLVATDALSLPVTLYLDYLTTKLLCSWSFNVTL